MIWPRMRYAILLAPEADQDLRRLRAHDRAAVKGVARPQYRLHVGEFRVFYDVAGTTVAVLAVVSKSRAEEWLKKAGEPS